LLICAAEESERGRALGPIYGYVDQEITIDADGYIIPAELALLLETSGGGEKTYELARPGEVSPSGFLFELLPGNKICVRRPEISGTCRAYIAACAVTLGAEGNVREGNAFTAFTPEGEKADAFVNPGAGRGGLSPETTADLRARFAACLQTPWAAVTAADYEELVRGAPGLCIHKVKALPVPRDNLMRIAVMPRSEEMFPRLPDSYIRRLSALLSARRMLAAAFTLVQPEYIPINVQASVQVKSRFAGAREDIEQALRQALDFVSTDVEFGTPVRFNRIFAVISRLPCVAAVIDLALAPGRRGAAGSDGLDIIPEGHCLCYPGQITLEIITRTDR
ncbi:MAG: baseplate J/gp47 family protein, partial [Gracilibacteraceae bacterium]|nr:baseplate J/gp47 family protein [Gracilibacteraceae bacterium]